MEIIFTPIYNRETNEIENLIQEKIKNRVKNDENRLSRSLKDFFWGENLFKSSKYKFIELYSKNKNINIKNNHLNEPYQLNFQLQNAINQKIDFIINLDIDKIYKLINENKLINKETLKIEDIDSLLAKTDGGRNQISPILVIGDNILSKCFIKKTNSKYFVIDGYHRLGKAIQNKNKFIEAYKLDVEDVLTISYSELDEIALELLLQYSKQFGIK